MADGIQQGLMQSIHCYLLTSKKNERLVMKDKTKLILSILIVVIPIIIIGVFFLNKDNLKQKIDISTLQKDLDEDMQKINEIDSQVGEEGYSEEQHGEIEKIIDKYSESENALNYFLAVVNSNDIGLFLEAFTAEIVEGDILTIPQKDRAKALEEMMKRISRYQTLESVVINEVMKGNIKDRFYVTFKYKEGSVKTSIELQNATVDAHLTNKIYLVSTSPWTLIKEIENKLGGLPEK